MKYIIPLLSFIVASLSQATALCSGAIAHSQGQYNVSSLDECCVVSTNGSSSHGQEPDIVWKVKNPGWYGKVVTNGTSVWGQSDLPLFNGTVLGWNLGSNQPQQVYNPPDLLDDYPIHNLEVSADGQLLAMFFSAGSGSKQRSWLRVIEASTGTQLLELRDPLGIRRGPVQLAFSHDNQFLAIGGTTNALYTFIGMYSLKDERWAWFRPGACAALATIPEVKLPFLITVENDRIQSSLRLRRLDGEIVWSRRLPTRADYKANIILHKQGYLIATHKVGGDTVQFRDLTRGDLKGELELPGNVTLFTFAPDRQKAAFRTNETWEPIVLMDLTSGQETARFDRYAPDPTSLAISPDGERLFVASSFFDSIYSYLLPSGEEERIYGGQLTFPTKITHYGSGQLITKEEQGVGYQMARGTCQWNPDNGDVIRYDTQVHPFEVALNGSVSARWFLNEVTVYQGWSGTFLRTIPYPKQDIVTKVEFTPLGAHMIVTRLVDGSYEQARVYNPWTGDEVQNFINGDFTRDGNLVFFDVGSVVYVHRTSDWQQVARVELFTILPGHEIRSVTPSPDGSRMLVFSTLSGANYLSCVSLGGALLRPSINIPLNDWAEWTFTYDSSKFITSISTSTSSQLSFWDATGGSPLTYDGIKARRIEVSPDGKHYFFYWVDRELVIDINRYPFSYLCCALIP